MNKIYLNEAKIVINCQDAAILTEIKKQFTYQDDSLCFLSGGYDKDRIKNICFVHKMKEFHWMNKGFLMELAKLIKTKGWIFEFKDERKAVKFDKDIETVKEILSGIVLYDYQVEAVKKALNHRFGIIKAFTSFGKSITMAAILKYIDKPFLILVNKKTLATQLHTELNKFGVECGLLHSQKKIIKDSMITTVQSVLKLNKLADIGVICVDECHNASSATYQDFLSKMKSPFMLGFSATPFKNKYHAALVKQYLGDIIYDISIKDGIENKIIAKPYVYFINNTAPKAHDWPSSEDKGIINNKNRNEQISYFVNENPDKHFLIIIDKIRHGMLLQSLIPNSIFVEGNTSEKDRQSAIRMMESDDIKCIIASKIFLEGISIKQIDCMINAAGMKAEHNTIQRAGRALRLKEGKEKATIIEFLDKGNKILVAQSRSRLGAYKKTGYTDIFKVDDITQIVL